MVSLRLRSVGYFDHKLLFRSANKLNSFIFFTLCNFLFCLFVKQCDSARISIFSSLPCRNILLVLRKTRRDFDEKKKKHYANFLPYSYGSIAVRLFAIKKNQEHSQIIWEEEQKTHRILYRLATSTQDKRMGHKIARSHQLEFLLKIYTCTKKKKTASHNINTSGTHQFYIFCGVISFFLYDCVFANFLGSLFFQRLLRRISLAKIWQPNENTVKCKNKKNIDTTMTTGNIEWKFRTKQRKKLSPLNGDRHCSQLSFFEYVG